MKIVNLYLSSSPLVFLECSAFQAVYTLYKSLSPDYKVTCYSFPEMKRATPAKATKAIRAN